MIYSEYRVEQEINDILEESFDTCSSNKEEIVWLITLLRAFMKIPNKRLENVAENYQLNAWQMQINPRIKEFLKKWRL